MAFANQIQIKQGGSTTIDLTNDGFTDAIFVIDLTGAWALQPVNVTGLVGGVPTWSLQYSLDGSTWGEFEPDYTTDVIISEGRRGVGSGNVTYWRLGIKANTTMAGTCEILLNQ